VNSIEFDNGYNKHMYVSKVLAFIILIIFSPIFIIISITILFSDGFPIIFKQKRIGVNNGIFWLYKFRTMRKEIPDIPTHLIDGNQKLYIRSGQILRKISIDELPQLINIIKGEMVFVGPRPALHNQDDLIELRTNVGIHELIPGVTGWAQVNGRDELNIPEKVKLDEYYLQNKSFWLNIKILFITGVQILFPKGVSH